MPFIETPCDLAESLADMIGIYGACSETSEKECDGKCRPHFVIEITERIRQASRNESLINKENI